MTKSAGFSNGGRSTGDATIGRVISAAQTHAWGLVPGPSGGVMATRESGRVGEPWVVLAERGGRGMRVSLYRPGDAIDQQGDALGELAGNPREMGRQLRALLEDLPLDEAGPIDGE